MADLAAGDVTYTKQDKSDMKDNAGLRHGVYKLAFGDGALTYPSGGVPLTQANLGCPNSIESLVFVDEGNANGNHYKYDYVNKKIRIYNTSNVEFTGGSTAISATSLYVRVVGW